MIVIPCVFPFHCHNNVWRFDIRFQSVFLFFCFLLHFIHPSSCYTSPCEHVIGRKQTFREGENKAQGKENNSQFADLHLERRSSGTCFGERCWIFTVRRSPLDKTSYDPLSFQHKHGHEITSGSNSVSGYRGVRVHFHVSKRLQASTVCLRCPSSETPVNLLQLAAAKVQFWINGLASSRRGQSGVMECCHSFTK